MEVIQLDNKRIVRKIKKGELRALADWTDNRKDKLYKIAWSYLYNHNDIEDVFQDTFLRIHENIYTLKNPNYFETWYISILLNECKQKLRTKKKEVLQGDIEVHNYHMDQYNFFQEINSIDEIFKEVIVLKYVSGYSQEEISKILDIPLGTVKSRIYRGLRQLRNLLEEV